MTVKKIEKFYPTNVIDKSLPDFFWLDFYYMSLQEEEISPHHASDHRRRRKTAQTSLTDSTLQQKRCFGTSGFFSCGTLPWLSGTCDTLANQGVLWDPDLLDTNVYLIEYVVSLKTIYCLCLTNGQFKSGKNRYSNCIPNPHWPCSVFPQKSKNI